MTAGENFRHGSENANLGTNRRPAPACISPLTGDAEAEEKRRFVLFLFFPDGAAAIYGEIFESACPQTDRLFYRNQPLSGSAYAGLDPVPFRLTRHHHGPGDPQPLARQPRQHYRCRKPQGKQHPQHPLCHEGESSRSFRPCLPQRRSDLESSPPRQTFTHQQVEIDDTEEEDILNHLIACISFIEAELEKGHGVLVHCQAGMSAIAPAGSDPVAESSLRSQPHYRRGVYHVFSSPGYRGRSTAHQRIPSRRRVRLLHKFRNMAQPDNFRLIVRTPASWSSLMYSTALPTKFRETIRLPACSISNERCKRS